ncbi:unnamed protein product [Didymodactylos carnosus]|uniref:Uncharacterized protein n=1 Tax=Didymodactylos carnosus TaxID=1234261 RepID=A0A8S2P633_9BILA|nr:unnamed protein product [Didymodactylos carnosus]CAF4036027.1 unnamed protein product [Didymodactylos carnosus]
MKGQQGQMHNLPSYANKNAVNRDLNTVYDNGNDQMNRNGQNKRTNEFSDEEAQQQQSNRAKQQQENRAQLWSGEACSQQVSVPRQDNVAEPGGNFDQRNSSRTQQREENYLRNQSHPVQQQQNNRAQLPSGEAHSGQVSVPRPDNVAEPGRNFNRERQEHGNNAQFDISEQAMRFAVETQYVPIKLVCEPKVQLKETAVKMSTDLIEHIKNDFRRENPNFMGALLFDSCWIDSTGDVQLLTKTTALYVFLCRKDRYPRKLCDIEVMPLPPRHLPPHHTAIIKWVQKSVQDAEIKQELDKKYTKFEEKYKAIQLKLDLMEKRHEEEQIVAEKLRDMEKQKIEEKYRLHRNKINQIWLQTDAYQEVQQKMLKKCLTSQKEVAIANIKVITAGLDVVDQLRTKHNIPTFDKIVESLNTQLNYAESTKRRLTQQQNEFHTVLAEFNGEKKKSFTRNSP